MSRVMMLSDFERRENGGYEDDDFGDDDFGRRRRRRPRRMPRRRSRADDGYYVDQPQDEQQDEPMEDEDEGRGGGGRRRRRRRRPVGRRQRRREEKRRYRRVRKQRPDGRWVEVVEEIPFEESPPSDFPVDEDLEEALDEMEDAPGEEIVEEVGAMLRDGWGSIARVGNLRIQPKQGLRAAVMELKPGLYIVAEIPEQALAQRDDLSGPVKMATKITEAAIDALRRPPETRPAIGWRERARAHKCRCQWESED